MKNKLKIIHILVAAALFVMALVSILKGTSNGLSKAPIDFIWDDFNIAITQRKFLMPQFPSMMMPITMLGFFPFRTAQIIWLIMQFVCTAVLVFSIKKNFFVKKDDYLFITSILLMIAGAPWRTNLSNLQYTLFAFSFYLLGLYFMNSGHEILSGFFMSLSLFKIQLIVPLLAVILFKRKWKPLFYIIITQLLLLAITAWWGGSFYDITWGHLGAIKSLSSASGFVDIGNLFKNSNWGIIVALISLLVIGIVSWRISEIEQRGREMIFNIYFSWLLLISLVITYHRIYDYFMCIIPLAVFYEEMKEQRTLLTKVNFFLCLMFVLTINFGVTLQEKISYQLARVECYSLIVCASIYLFKKVVEIKSRAVVINNQKPLDKQDLFSNG